LVRKIQRKENQSISNKLKGTMPKTKGSTSFVAVRLGDLGKYFMPEASVIVSRKWLEKTGYGTLAQKIESKAEEIEKQAGAIEFKVIE
jgi:hypothetical protein